MAPGFPANARDIQVLKTPTEFYEQLLTFISQAEKTITISSLYLGTGEYEQRLVEALSKRAEERPELQIHVVLDYLRGTRVTDGKSSLTLLAPLLQKLPKSAKLSLVHMPCDDLLGYVLRGKQREVLGVHHMKLYMFDDCLMISGANLSEIYFKQRQDRYIVLNRNQRIVDYYSAILHALTTSALACNLSANANNNNQDIASFSSPSSPPPPPKPSEEEKQQLTSQLRTLIAPPTIPLSELREATTWLFPTIQIGLLGITQEEEFSRFIFNLCSRPTLRVDIASGYCNFPVKHLRSILGARGTVNVITPSPEANGFWGATGVLRYVTGAYDYFSRAFLDRVLIANKADEVHLLEYYREGWSFHAKGAWVRPDVRTAKGPYLTLVGSSNFGARSVCRDSEAELCIFTESAALGSQLMQELEDMKNTCDEVNEAAITTGNLARELPTWPTVIISQIFASYL